MHIFDVCQPASILGHQTLSFPTRHFFESIKIPSVIALKGEKYYECTHSKAIRLDNIDEISSLGH